MGAQVTVVDRSADALKRLASQFGTSISTVFSTRGDRGTGAVAPTW
jgi:alanine dehydrogenase